MRFYAGLLTGVLAIAIAVAVHIVSRYEIVPAEVAEDGEDDEDDDLLHWVCNNDSECPDYPPDGDQ